MLIIETDKIKEIKSIVEGLSGIIDEIQLNIKKKSIELDAIDKEHISYIKLKINSYYFDKYYINKEEKLNIDLKLIKDILHGIKSKGIINLKYNSEGLILEYKSKINKTFKIKPIHIDYYTPKPPKNIEDMKKIEIPLKILDNFLKDINLISQETKIELEKNQIKFKTNGKLTSIENIYTHKKTIDKKTENKYTIEKIKQFLKINKISKNIKLEMANNSPLKLTIEDLNIKIEYIQAPKIE